MPLDPIVPNSVPSEVEVDASLVRALIEHRFPGRFGPHPSVRRFTEGWDNVLFAIGDPTSHLVRLPRRALGARTLRREAEVLPTVGPRIPCCTPWPSEYAEPALGFPFPWALTPFHPGTPAGRCPDLDAEACAERLHTVLSALHQAAPAGPTHASRSTGLLARQDRTNAQLEALDVQSARVLRSVFERGLAAPPHAGPPVWTHGDLHPFNLLVRDGVLSAVLDWGDAFAGDPAPDLAAPWMLLEPRHHGPFRTLHGEAAWARGCGWAVVYALTLRTAADAGATGFRPVAEATVRRLVAVHAHR